MAFEGIRLRDLTEANVRALVDSGVAEHLYLEYKQGIYSNNHDGKKEFLLDTCMFANAQGGVILVGIPELRDASGQPTGLPDPAEELGIRLDNPEALLLSYDAKVVSSIEERLAIESRAIRLANGHYILAFRIPDSSLKPHSARLDGHTYFPSRRERHRYFMDVREIKELTMRIASQRERATELMGGYLGRASGLESPVLVIALVPIFFRDFLVDVKREPVFDSIRRFYLGQALRLVQPDFTLEGLFRKDQARDEVTLSRDGTIAASVSLTTRRVGQRGGIDPRGIDLILRRFMIRAQVVYQATEIPAPLLLGLTLRNNLALVATYADHQYELAPGANVFPPIYLETIVDSADKRIRPLCDVVHQTFGMRESPCFGADGNWNFIP